jgi:hypothetical protein
MNPLTLMKKARAAAMATISDQALMRHQYQRIASVDAAASCLPGCPLDIQIAFT